MRFLVILFIFCLQTIQTYSQVTEKEEQILTRVPDSLSGWNFDGIITTNFSQISLVNWASGGQNSISFNGMTNLQLTYKSQKQSWVTQLDMGYGMIRQGDKDQPFIKSDDRFELTSKYGRKVSKSWYYAGLLSFKSQFSAGYNYPNDSVIISDFMAPGYLLVALGMDYKPNDIFFAYIAPITSKTTFVSSQRLADKGAFGVDPATYDEDSSIVTNGKKIRYEIGGYIRSSVKKEIMKNVLMEAKVDLFSNYLENPQNIDINSEVIITMKINEYLTTSLFTHAIYDDDIIIEVDSDNDGEVDAAGPRLQLKEVFGVGFSYKFK